MEFESAQSNTTAKLPILKLGEYEMWVIRIKQYFQVQDYALWEVIENGNSWVSVPQTAQENGTSVTKMSVPVTAEEKTNKKNDVKARSLLLMALPNEHQLTFSQYTDAKTMFAAIKTRFGGNEATKKTQKTLLKQQYENFSASSTESLDSIFNRLQKIVSRLAILGVVIAQEDLNSKFLSSLPPEWNTHVVVWMNKAEIETMSIDDLYNFKIVKQSVKKSVGASSGAQNLAFMTALILFAKYEGKEVECFNCHKMGHFAKECRAPRNKEGQLKNQDTTRKQGNNEDTSSKAMLAIDGVEQVSEDTSSFVESSLNVKRNCFSCENDVESVKPKNHKNPVNKSVGSLYSPYASMETGPRAVLMKTGLKTFNTARTVNTAHPNLSFLGKPQQDDIRFVDSGCSRHMTGNIAYLSDFKEFDEGYVTFGGGAHGGSRISG
ncbi:ribonuclease H-like domain-containing protein [Tanacetum coccineum]